jgi:serine phosphatase RsbU (regulator of sigma subunit)
VFTRFRDSGPARDWRREWRSRLITWAFVPAMLVLASVAVITFLAYEKVTGDLVIERDRELTYLSAARMREEMSKFTDALAALARSADVSQSGNDMARQRQALADATLRLAVFDGGVVMLNNFGRVTAAEPPRPEILNQDWSYKTYFRRMIGNQSEVFSDATTDGPGGAQVVVLAVPVTGPRGEFQGVLAGMFRIGSPTISAFYASIVRLRMGQSGSTYLVDSTGEVIYHSDFAQIGKVYAYDPIVQRVLAGEAGAQRATDTDGHDLVSAYAPVPGTPWGLVSEEDWNVLTGSSRGYVQQLLVLLLLGMLLPAAGVALFARQRRAEAVEQARVDQEMRVARIIQETLLPKQLPALPGWQVQVHWQPARAVGGDFYDFITLPSGRLAIVMGDVTDKGMPAALVMASARSILRAAAERLESPGQVLRRANDVLVPDMPPRMFITCFYAVLDPDSGRLWYANAGHNYPYWRTKSGVAELKASGMPLGLLPGMQYDEGETTLQEGEYLLVYSDGLVEAHNPKSQMFGFPRLLQLMADYTGKFPRLIEYLLGQLAAFTGKGWEQEDDVTLLTLLRCPLEEPAVAGDRAQHQPDDDLNSAPLEPELTATAGGPR